MTRFLALLRAGLRSNFGLSLLRYRLFVEKKDRWLVPLIGLAGVAVLPSVYGLILLVQRIYLGPQAARPGARPSHAGGPRGRALHPSLRALLRHLGFLFLARPRVPRPPAAQAVRGHGLEVRRDHGQRVPDGHGHRPARPRRLRGHVARRAGLLAERPPRLPPAPGHPPGGRLAPGRGPDARRQHQPEKGRPHPRRERPADRGGNGGSARGRTGWPRRPRRPGGDPFLHLARQPPQRRRLPLPSEHLGDEGRRRGLLGRRASGTWPFSPASRSPSSPPSCFSARSSSTAASSGSARSPAGGGA